MRLAVVPIMLFAAAIAGCDRRQSPGADSRDQPAPVAAGTALTPAASPDGAAPSAAPAAAVGAASEHRTPGTDREMTAARKASERPTSDVWQEVTLPAGTALPVVLDTPVASNSSRVEAAVEAHLSRPVVVGGVTAIARGSRVEGVVTDATRTGKVKGRASIGLRFDRLLPAGDEEHYAIHTSPISRRAAATKKNDTVKILAPAVGGAIIGRIVGGRKGAAIGAGTGAGAGTAVVMSTRGKDVSLAKGATLTLKLTRPVVLRVRS